MVDEPVTLDAVAARQLRLRRAGAIICVFFMLALGGGIQAVTNTARANGHTIHRLEMDEAQLKRDEAKLAGQQSAIQAAVRAARIGSCQDENDVKAGLLRYIKQLTQRSLITSAATIASPTATAQQKAAARGSLHSIADALTKAETAFAPKTCS